VIAFVAFAAWTERRGGREPVVAFDDPPRPANYPPVDTSVSDTPLGQPPPVPEPAGPVEFAVTQPDSGDPATWDPRRPFRYVVNPSGAPPMGAE
jgi:hypothetical protein